MEFASHSSGPEDQPYVFNLPAFDLDAIDFTVSDHEGEAEEESGDQGLAFR